MTTFEVDRSIERDLRHLRKLRDHRMMLRDRAELLVLDPTDKHRVELNGLLLDIASNQMRINRLERQLVGLSW